MHRPKPMSHKEMCINLNLRHGEVENFVGGKRISVAHVARRILYEYITSAL